MTKRRPPQRRDTPCATTLSTLRSVCVSSPRVIGWPIAARRGSSDGFRGRQDRRGLSSRPWLPYPPLRRLSGTAVASEGRAAGGRRRARRGRGRPRASPERRWDARGVTAATATHYWCRRGWSAASASPRAGGTQSNVSPCSKCPSSATSGIVRVRPLWMMSTVTTPWADCSRSRVAKVVGWS